MESGSDNEALVEYDYEAQHTDELTIRVGDVVTDLAPTEPGWMRGKLRGKVGVFPDNFVKMVHRDMAKPRPKPSDASTTGSLKTNGVTRRTQDATKRPGRRRCKALFSYSPEKADELGLKLNDIIDVLEEVEPGWWKGSLNGKVGVFPSNFVEELPPLPDADVVQEIKPKPVKGVGLGDILREAKSRPPPPQLPRPPDPTPAPQLPPKPVKELCRALFAYQRQNDDELTLKEGDVVTIVSKESDDKGWWRGELAGKIGVFPDNFVEVISSAEKPARPGKPPSKSSGRTEAPQASGRPTSTGADAGKTASAAQPPTAAEPAGETERVPVMSQPPAAPAPAPAPAADPAPAPAQTPSPPPPLPKTPPPKQASPKPPPLSAKPTAAPPVSGPKPTAAPPTNASDTANSPVQTEVAPPAAAAPASVTDGPKKTPKPDGDTSLEEFDVVERCSERLTHITADRARAPGRRPTSTIFSRESMSPQPPASPATPTEAPLSEEPELVNGAAEREAAAPPVSPTAQAAPPWMRELQRAQIKRNSRLVETDDEKTERQTTEPSSAAAAAAESSPVLSPSAAPARPPWMSELQRAHSKKQPSRVKDDEKASGDTQPAADLVDSSPAPAPVPAPAAPSRPARPELPAEVKVRKPAASRIAPKPADPPAAPAAAAAPPRPVTPAAAAAAAAAAVGAAATDTRQLQEQVTQLQKQLAEQSRQFTDALTALRSDYTKKMRTVLDELDSEKKARLVMQVQLDRLDKLVKDMNFSV